MTNRKMTWFLGVLVLSFLFSCEKENDDESNFNKEMSSSFNENESHNSGQNCMSCHNSGGNGEGIFTIGGTVYNASKTAAYPNALVKFYTGSNGTGNLVKTIEVDGKGNFYTTADIDFGKGLYVTVTGTSGNVSSMNSSVSTGQCNSCHGSNTDRISVN